MQVTPFPAAQVCVSVRTGKFAAHVLVPLHERRDCHRGGRMTSVREVSGASSWHMREHHLPSRKHTSEVAGQIIIAWVLTVPLCMLLGAVAYWLIS